MTEVDVNALIEKATALEKSNEEFKIRVADLDKQKAELETALGNKDAEIGKLQKLLADNLIAGKEPKTGGVEMKSFESAYKEAIANNTPERK